MKTLTVGLTIPFFASRALAVEHKYACPGAKSHCESPLDYACFNFDGYNDPNDKSSLKSSMTQAWVRAEAFALTSAVMKIHHRR